MKNFLKLALIAIIALVNNNVFAQETASTEMNLYGLKDKVWQVGQSLDGDHIQTRLQKSKSASAKVMVMKTLPLSNMTPRKTV